MAEIGAAAQPFDNLTPSTTWGRLAAVRVGPVPLPLYVVLCAVTALAAASGVLPNDVIGGLSVMLLAGFLLGELGARLPVLRQIGGTAILCLFVPAALVGYGIVNEAVMKAVTTTFRTANFQYFYIACLVAGSILGMPHKVLVQGFLRMFVPLTIGTAAAVGAGLLVGLAFGHSPSDTFFFILVPILGGGLAEGVLPLSIGYSEILGRPQGELVALMVPAALMANVVAIVGSGVLARVFARSERFNGNGMLVRAGDDDVLAAQGPALPIDLRLMGMGLLLACGFFILGAEVAPFTGIPGPILMIIGAALVKVARVLPAEAELGALQIYKFMSTNLTFGILVAMGMLLVSWPQLVASFSPGYMAVCAATVLSMIAAGFFVGLWLKMYPVESAIVTACHSGLGGTGDVAILSAADRMGLMPFAQISTRIGGALMVVLATVLLRAVHG